MSNAKHVIAIEPRSEFGNNASRRLRRASRIPAVVYSKGKEARSISVSADEWKTIAGHGVNMISLSENGKETPVLIKEVQINYLKDYVVHIDFQEVDLTAEIEVNVPLHAINLADAQLHGGILEQAVHDLAITCRPDCLPEIIKVDVSKIEQAITAADLVLPEGVKAAVPADTVIFTVVFPEEAEPEAPAEETEAAAEPEAINEKKTEARAAAKEAAAAAAAKK